MEHKQSGSKAIYRFSEGKQIVEDAYFAKWKVNTINTILQAQTSSQKQALKLSDLCIALQKKSPAKVLKQLNIILEEKNSIIMHTGFCRIWKKQNIKVIFQNAIAQGEKIYQQNYIKTRTRSIAAPTLDYKISVVETKSTPVNHTNQDEEIPILENLDVEKLEEAESEADFSSDDVPSFAELERRFTALILPSSVWSDPRPCSESEKSSPQASSSLTFPS